MNTTQTLSPASVVRSIYGHAWALFVWIFVAALMLLAMGASAHDDSANQVEGARTAETTPAARSAIEREWNEREDLKAGRYVGLPGIY